MSDISTIIGATTNAISTAKQLAEMGPATGLSGIVDTITGDIKTSFENIGNIFSSTGSGIMTSDLELPLLNPLHKYASYNYIFSLSCLDADSANYPVTSYMAGNIPPLILKSGSRDPNNRIQMDDGNKYEFYIDELSMTGQYGFEKGTGNVNSTNIEFKVIEPYSMGMFMIVCQTAAYNQGYKNYNDATFLLTIEFRGNTESGKIEEIPYTTKFIPFKLNNVELSVTSAGSTYNIIGVISNGAALNDTYKQLKSDTTISGVTIQEILQTGGKSLQNVVNARFREAVKDNLVAVPDEIIIIFPQDYSTDKNGSGQSGNAAKEEKTSATIDPKSKLVNDPKLFKQLGVTRSGSNQMLVQKDGDCNAIGRAKLGFDPSRGGTAPFAKENQVYDSKTKTNVGANNTATPGATDFKFQNGSDIINAINQVLLKSEIAVAALKPDQISKEGMRPWWRIDVQTYHIASDENMKTTGVIPQVIVYRVIPYAVHSSRMLAPNAPAPGIKELTKQAAKVYDYIYTGKNIDVLKFDITINQTFYQVMMADNFKRSGDVETAAQTASGSKENKTANIPVPTSPTKPKAGIMTTVAKFVGLETSTDNKGGTRGETEASRAARLFHDSILNGQDMMNITIEIVGDPYYIANSGAGNYTATATNLINVTKDGDINYQNGEVDIVINFRTPTDINQATGLYNLNPKSNLVGQFSGLYKITTIASSFKNGQFTQVLTCNRRAGQDSPDKPTPSSFLGSDKIVDTQLGKKISNAITPVLESLDKTIQNVNTAADKVTADITTYLGGGQ